MQDKPSAEKETEMMNLKQWMSDHKKATATIGAVLVAAGSGLSGTQPWGTVVLEIVGLVGAFVGAQGLADIGKEKAKVEKSKK